MSKAWNGMVAALLLGACSGDDQGDVYGPPTCDGGGEPIVEIGSGGQLGFEPYGNGELVPVRADGETIEVQLWTSGIDTTDSVLVTIRTSIGGGASKDSSSTFTMVCNEDDGHGWLGAFPFLPDEAADGDIVAVVATVTDALETSVSSEVELEVQF